MMTAKTESYAGCKILSVGGRIDFESAMEFERHVNAMIREAADYYIIELSQVDLLSSAGLRVMLSTAKRVAQRNASLALAAPSSVVRQVFEISHFNLLFKIFASVPEAIAALKGTPVGPEAPPVDRAETPGGLMRQEANISESVPVVPRPPIEVENPRAEPPALEKPPLIPESLAQPPPPVPSPIDSSPPETVEPPLAPISRSAIKLSAAEAPTVTPHSLPAGARPDPGSPVRTQVDGPTQQVQPPPLPPRESIPVPAPTRTGGPVARRDATCPARLEVRAEGTSYPCKDGDVIGTEGKLAQPFFSQVTNLAPRHLLIGQLEGRWFVFTPKNVQLPFTLDGVVLHAGERKMLQYVEHQVEFSGHVFGFRLVPEEGKGGFLSRVFGSKK